MVSIIEPVCAVHSTYLYTDSFGNKAEFKPVAAYYSFYLSYILHNRNSKSSVLL